MSRFRSRFRAGEWVEVRSSKEILATLDHQGEIDSVPFMPEMLRHCGKRFRVAASAHKTCDTVNKTGGRRLRETVHLDGLRCDGSAHGGCQAACLIFWKEAWLKPAGAPAATGVPRSPPAGAPIDDEALLKQARLDGDDPQDPTYVCQATRLFEASTLLKRWQPRQYIADVRSRNVSLLEAGKILLLAFIYNLRELKVGYRLTRWLYDRTHQAIRGCPSPYGTGSIPRGNPTPNAKLDLQVGEIARVKPHQEILATLDTRSQNRGMRFDKEMVRYCGKEFRVGARVERIVNESTGKMLHLPNPSVALDGTYCTSQYSERRLMCPRRIVPFWREVWLERADPEPPPATESAIRFVPRATAGREDL